MHVRLRRLKRFNSRGKQFLSLHNARTTPRPCQRRAAYRAPSRQRAVGDPPSRRISACVSLRSLTIPECSLSSAKGSPADDLIQPPERINPAPGASPQASDGDAVCPIGTGECELCPITPTGDTHWRCFETKAMRSGCRRISHTLALGPRVAPYETRRWFGGVHASSRSCVTKHALSELA